MSEATVTKRSDDGYDIAIGDGPHAGRYVVKSPDAQQCHDVFAVDQSGVERDCIGCLQVKTTGPTAPGPVAGAPNHSHVSGPSVIPVSPFRQAHRSRLDVIGQALLHYLETH